MNFVSDLVHVSYYLIAFYYNLIYYMYKLLEQVFHIYE